MATLKEQLKCECNSEWSYLWIDYYMGEMPTQVLLEINNFYYQCEKCLTFPWFNPSELNEWFDLRSMNTIW